MTSTQTLPSAVVGIEDRGAVIEKAQREYAAEHGIELTENEFALAKAGELVRIERLGLPATETRLVKAAQAGIRGVASRSRRPRPLGRFELIGVWALPLLVVALTGAAMWAVRDLHSEVTTTQYPAWLPTDITDALPGYMDWFWVVVAIFGGLATVATLIAAASATWWTRTYATATLVARAVVTMTMLVLWTFVVVATVYAITMTGLPAAGGVQ